MAPVASATVEAWSIARVLDWAARDFAARRFDSPRLDAEVLLANVLGFERIRLVLDSERRLTAPELTAYRDCIQRRRTGEPVAYIVGTREFYGLVFRVDRRVLVPRPDTETLVDVALHRTRRRSLSGTALDLCTGSGCVAIAFAKHRPTWQVTGVDVSPEAIAVARNNALRLGAVWGTRFLEGDLAAPLGPDQDFDLVTANPPYIPSADIAGLQRDVRDFEPPLALDGGPDGLAVMRRVVAAAVPLLRPGGVLALEVQAGQADAVAALCDEAGLEGIERRTDLARIERVVSGRARG